MRQDDGANPVGPERPAVRAYCERPWPLQPYKLDDLLSGVTQDNVHGEILTGRPVGREAW
jgi:hypothetical protein